MQAVKRVEIVIDALEAEAVIKRIAESGVGGYTLLRDVEGMGDRGLRRADELTGVNQSVYFLVACPPHLVSGLVEAVRPMLKRFGGICLVSDAQWVIH
ncbi:MAG: P-II family nitrogen regulator [Caldilineaceae bacterium]